MFWGPRFRVLWPGAAWLIFLPTRASSALEYGPMGRRLHLSTRFPELPGPRRRFPTSPTAGGGKTPFFWFAPPPTPPNSLLGILAAPPPPLPPPPAPAPPCTLSAATLP